MDGRGFFCEEVTIASYRVAPTTVPEAGVVTDGSYDREWSTSRGLPTATRLRVGYTTERGTPIRFVVQLECRRDASWRQVARFDHDRDGPVYRNVERVGLHLDLYDLDGNQVAKFTRGPPQPAETAMSAAEQYLRENAQHLVRRSEQWQ